MELWDAYDKDFHKVDGISLVRGTPIPDGLYHLVCDVIVQHTDGSYLLMQRDPRKHYGGLWEATAGGSALMGESPLECIKRELFEETGIYAEHPRELGCLIDNRSIYVEYLHITNCLKDSIILQPGETVAYKWVSVEELKNMKKSELITERMHQFMKELQFGC